MTYKTGNINAEVAGNTAVFGGATIDPKAILDLQSTTRGMILPTMDTAQRDTLQPSITLSYSIFMNGDNGRGQAGRGDLVTPVLSPIQVETSTNWTSVSAGWFGGYFINVLKELWGVGGNEEGQLGQGSVSFEETSPVQIGSATNWVSASQGLTHGYFINEVGELWGVGYNGNGQLAQGDFTSPVTTLVQMEVATNWVVAVAGKNSGYFINSLGELWTCGRNSSGQLGQGNGLASNVLLQIGTASDWVSVSSKGDTVYAINTLGELWGCGENGVGQLGLGNTTTPQDVFVQIGVSTDWDSVSAGDRHVYIINNSGQMYATGDNAAGQLGRGAPTFNEDTLDLVGAASNWVSAKGGSSHGRFINTTGEIWGCGENFSGELGLGNNTSPIASPIQSGVGTDWVSVTAGGPHTYALK